MGNCIDVLWFRPQKKIRVLIFDGGEKEFEALTKVEKVISGPYNGYKLVHHAQPYLPIPPDTELKSGEVYYLVPHLGCLYSPPFSRKMVDDDSCKGRKVKIVVNKEQLELLLRSVESQSLKVAIQSFLGSEGCQKWQPSLATIPEY